MRLKSVGAAREALARASVAPASRAAAAAACALASALTPGSAAMSFSARPVAAVAGVSSLIAWESSFSKRALWSTAFCGLSWPAFWASTSGWLTMFRISAFCQ